MANRIVIAGVVAFIGIVLLSPINNLFKSTLLPMINNTTGVTPFENATWKFVPLILFIFIGLAVLVALIKKEEDQNKPPQ